METIASVSMQVPLRNFHRVKKSIASTENEQGQKRVKWKRADVSNQEALVEVLQTLYWAGVRRELAEMILSLHEWQQAQHPNEKWNGGAPERIEGYEHFISQVSLTSREFAKRYGMERKRHLNQKKSRFRKKRTYEEYAQDVFLNHLREYEDRQLKSDIRVNLPRRQENDPLEQRARLLLQSAAFLDVDKVITYNSPLPKANFWRKSAQPQLTLLRFDAGSMPDLRAMRCRTCGDVIRGSLFKCLEPKCEAHLPLTQKDSICETCFRAPSHPPNHMTKFYKHYILRDIITPKVSRQICVCSAETRGGPLAARTAPFPIDKNFPHRGRGKARVLKCGLLLLSDKVMEAKFQSSVSQIEKKQAQMQQKQMERHRKRVLKEGKARKAAQEFASKRQKQRANKTAKSPKNTDPQAQAQEKTMSDVENEKAADQEIPFLYRRFANRYPFGNVHVALMFGPLMIENGVPE